MISPNTSGGPNNLSLLHINTPLVNPATGTINPRWWLFFQNLYTRVGGSDAPSITEINNSITNIISSGGGVSGEDGEDGQDGLQGPPGPRGLPGASGPMYTSDADDIDVLSEALSLAESITTAKSPLGTLLTATNTLIPGNFASGYTNNVVTMAIGAGTWIVNGSFFMTPQTGCVIQRAVGGLNTMAGNLPAQPYYMQLGDFTTTNNTGFSVPTQVMTITGSSTSVYLVADPTFSGAFCGCSGSIIALQIA